MLFKTSLIQLTTRRLTTPLNLLILTSYFAMEPNKVRGGIGYRYAGLYGSLSKILLGYSSDSKVFWYTHRDRSLRTINNNGIQRRNSTMSNALIYTVAETLKNRSRLAVIIAYPYAFPGIKKATEYFFCLVMLKFFCLGRVKLIVDDFDPPVEGACAFNAKPPSTLWKTYQRVLEMLTLKLASYVLALSVFWKQHFTRTYHLNKKNILVVPNGSLTGRIPYNPPKSEGPITVLYAGSAMKVKDVDKLIQAIEKLTEKGLMMDLCIAGAEEMYLPPWVHVLSYDWPDFVDKVLASSDICVIPYPPSKFTFNNSLPAKLLDYMSAGKPVVSTNLRGVRNIVETFKCGLIARDWNEFALFLEKLYWNRMYATNLGENGRKAAQKNFDYELVAKSLLMDIIGMFKSDV